jgi:uncharacterized protein YbbC (DUF1343 family)
MTTGELARLFNGEKKLGTTLTVITLSGWKRHQSFPQYGGSWVAPSPNIRSWRQALLYSGIGLLETTNLSVGRGTSAPFTLLGAPWIDARQLANAINQAKLEGIIALPTTFTPRAKPYRGKACHGVRLLLTAPERANPSALAVAIASYLHRAYPRKWDVGRLGRLINHQATTRAILAGQSSAQIVKSWGRDHNSFRTTRRRYLLYQKNDQAN